jgi:hypothetical protein
MIIINNRVYDHYYNSTIINNRVYNSSILLFGDNFVDLLVDDNPRNKRIGLRDYSNTQIQIYNQYSTIGCQFLLGTTIIQERGIPN